MLKRKEIYNIVNIIFLIGAFISLGKIFITEFNDFNKFIEPNILLLFIVFIIFFVLIHTIKLLRFYLVFIDAKIRFGRLIKIYMKTTFVNILLPFKTGELFRFYCYNNETDNYKVGILCILVERFFDTLGLIVLLIPIEFHTTHKLSISTVILLIFIVTLLYLYITFQGFYVYMNRFLIYNVSSPKSINGLMILEHLYEWYQYINKLITKRVVFIFGLSLAAWIMELIMFYLLSMIIHINFTLEVFSGYLNAALIGGYNPLLTIYRVGASALFAFILMFVYVPIIKRRLQNA